MRAGLQSHSFSSSRSLTFPNEAPSGHPEAPANTYQTNRHPSRQLSFPEPQPYNTGQPNGYTSTGLARQLSSSSRQGSMEVPNGSPSSLTGFRQQPDSGSRHTSTDMPNGSPSSPSGFRRQPSSGNRRFSVDMPNSPYASDAAQHNMAASPPETCRRASFDSASHSFPVTQPSRLSSQRPSSAWNQPPPTRPAAPPRPAAAAHPNLSPNRGSYRHPQPMYRQHSMRSNMSSLPDIDELDTSFTSTASEADTSDRALASSPHAQSPSARHSQYSSPIRRYQQSSLCSHGFSPRSQSASGGQSQNYSPTGQQQQSSLGSNGFSPRHRSPTAGPFQKSSSLGSNRSSPHDQSTSAGQSLNFSPTGQQQPSSLAGQVHTLRGYFQQPSMLSGHPSLPHVDEETTALSTMPASSNIGTQTDQDQAEPSQAGLNQTEHSEAGQRQAGHFQAGQSQAGQSQTGPPQSGQNQAVQVQEGQSSQQDSVNAADAAAAQAEASEKQDGAEQGRAEGPSGTGAVRVEDESPLQIPLLDAATQEPQQDAALAQKGTCDSDVPDSLLLSDSDSGAKQHIYNQSTKHANHYSSAMKAPWKLCKQFVFCGM